MTPACSRSSARKQKPQPRNLASLGLLLAQFTNLNRFLTGATGERSLGGSRGRLLVRSIADGRLWNGAVPGLAAGAQPRPLRQLISLADAAKGPSSPANQTPVEGAAEKPCPCGFVSGRRHVLLGETQVFRPSVVARSQPWGRLYVFGSSQGLSLERSHRVTSSWWPTSPLWPSRVNGVQEDMPPPMNGFDRQP